MEWVNKLPLHDYELDLTFQVLADCRFTTQKTKPDLFQAPHAFCSDSKWGDPT